MSLTLSIISLAVSLTACAGTAVCVFQVRSLRIQAEDAGGATRVSPEQRIKQRLEGSGGCAKLVSVGEHGCGLALPDRQNGRPTHPDGTPYRYHEIVVEGWGCCDACRQWGQWTVEDPHECPEPLKAATTVTVHGWDDPAVVGAEVARSLRRQRRNSGI
ncbi:hypothetical protein [Streptomyces sp. NPDC048445]|uniref:hypothetical protein n=1 Tax=Streptomyces sp. NPDC048445 TaxID=3365553 RepID=UPI0037223CC9